MNIVIVTNMQPFRPSEVQILATDLAQHLNAMAGLSAEVVRLPLNAEPSERLLEEMFIARGLSLPNIDRVIALEFPSYFVRHDQKILWLVRQFPPAQDASAAERAEFPNSPRGAEIRHVVVEADNACFRTAANVFSATESIRDRLLKENNFASDLLPVPLGHPETLVEHGANRLNWPQTIERLLA